MSSPQEITNSPPPSPPSLLPEGTTVTDTSSEGELAETGQTPAVKGFAGEAAARARSWPSCAVAS